MKQMILAGFMLCISTIAISQDTISRSSNMNVSVENRVAARDLRDLPPPAAALPVLQTFVAPDTVTQVTSKYGKGLYAITKLKVGNGQDAYQVALLENAQVRYEWIGADGSVVTDIYRVDTGGTTQGNQMNSTNNMNNNMNTNINRTDTSGMNRTDTMMNQNMGDSARRTTTDSLRINEPGTSLLRQNSFDVAFNIPFENKVQIAATLPNRNTLLRRRHS
jgi:hypothetical protein